MMDSLTIDTALHCLIGSVVAAGIVFALTWFLPLPPIEKTKPDPKTQAESEDDHDQPSPRP
jgi:hypothetical protein